MSEQLSFEGMQILSLQASLKSCKVGGLQKLRIGDKVRIEVEALVVSVSHQYDEKADGGARNHVLEALSATAIETL